MKNDFKRAINQLLDHNRYMKYIKKIIPNISYKRLLEIVKLRNQGLKWNGETRYWDKRFTKEKRRKNEKSNY